MVNGALSFESKSAVVKLSRALVGHAPAARCSGRDYTGMDIAVAQRAAIDGNADILGTSLREASWAYAFARFASMVSQILAATSGPPSRAMARMPVGEVTLISVRLPSITSMPTNSNPRSRR